MSTTRYCARFSRGRQLFASILAAATLASAIVDDEPAKASLDAVSTTPVASSTVLDMVEEKFEATTVALPLPEMTDDNTEIQLAAVRAEVVTQTYTVQRGDTLYEIAQQIGVPTEELWARNRELIGDDPHHIEEGWELLTHAPLQGEVTPIPVWQPPAPEPTPAAADTAEVANSTTPASSEGTGGSTSLLNQHDWTDVAMCESSLRWDINTGNGYYGGLQFSPQTWKDFGGHDFAPNAHEATPAEQIHVAEKLLAARDDEQWPTCGDRLKPGTTPLPDAPATEATAATAQQTIVEEAATQQPTEAQPASSGVHHPCPGCRLSSGFGERWGTTHYGIDLASPVGTPVYAAMGGVVQRAGPSNGFGQAIWVLQDDGSVAVYGHIDPFVSANQRVEGGQVIAQISENCPKCTGKHLHFEVHRDGNMYDDSFKIDSAAWLRERGVAI